nr:hypothetical protein [Desulfobacterales bacterium]
MKEFKKIATLDNGVEASLLRSILEERGLPHFMRSYYDTAYDGIYQTQKGWGEIRAPSEYQDEILQILTDIRKT